MSPLPVRIDSPRPHVRPDGSINAIAYWRGMFNRGAKYVLPHRVDRLVRDGGAMMQARDFDRLWRELTNEIACQKAFAKRRYDHLYDENKHIGLHQARTWLRRERAAEQRRMAA